MKLAIGSLVHLFTPYTLARTCCPDVFQAIFSGVLWSHNTEEEFLFLDVPVFVTRRVFHKPLPWFQRERGKKKKTAYCSANGQLDDRQVQFSSGTFCGFVILPSFLFFPYQYEWSFFFSAACGRVSVKESGQERAEEVLSKRKERKSQFHVLWLESSPYVIPLLFNSHLQFSITLVYWLFTLEEKANKKKVKENVRPRLPSFFLLSLACIVQYCG